ncbi:MAG TPA: hypothetical protein VIX19_22010 [Terriglobales bacterium]
MRDAYLPKALVLLLAMLPLSGCLLRSSHVVTSHLSTAMLKDATLEQLVEKINSQADRMQSFIANVDVDFSAGGQKKGKVTDYAELSGYILMRKPELLRMFMQAPVVRSRVFDMASNGNTFEVSWPPKNQFFVGSSRLMGKPSDNPLENLRPQVITDALVLKHIDPEDEIAVLENGTEMVKDPKTHKTVEQATYVVTVIRRSQGQWALSRKISFSRDTLLPHEQFIYDAKGQLVTYARYENVSDHHGIMFPDIIDIQRPIEELSFRLAVTKLRLNETIQDDQFILQQPPGSKLVDLDARSASAAQTGQDPAKDPQY